MLKLLFLDQDKDDLILVKELLGKEYFEIMTIDHPSMVFELTAITGDVPDVVIMNFRQPVLSSWELIGAIKNHPLLRRVVIIVLSLIDPVLMERSGLLADADAIILKPFSFEEYPVFVQRLKSVILNKVSNEHNRVRKDIRL